MLSHLVLVAKVAESTNSVISSAQASSVVPTAGEPSRANTTEMIEYHRMGPDIASSSVHSPHDIGKFEMANIINSILHYMLKKHSIQANEFYIEIIMNSQVVVKNNRVMPFT